MRTVVFFAVALLILSAGWKASAQSSWSTTGNTGTIAGTNFLGSKDAQDVVFKTQNTERGRIINNGGVWRFGTSLNYARIDAAGKLTFGGTGAYLVDANKYVFQNSSSPNVGLYFNQNAFTHEFRDQNGAVAASIGVNTGNGYFRGKLGVGTQTPSSTLQVVTDGSFTNGFKVSATTSTTVGAAICLDGSARDWDIVATNSAATAGANKLVFRDITLGADRMVIDASGNIGIGSIAPNYNLDVAGTGHFTGSLKVGAYTLPSIDGTAGQVLTSNGAGTVAWTTLSGSGNPWILSGSNVYYSGGNAGIGTATPVYKLDVAGTGRFNGSLKVGAYTFPSTDGAAGQVLASNGAGTLAWTTITSGGGSGPWASNGSTIYYTGSAGIGTSDLAAGYKLSVNGKIMCEEVRVQLAATWPDYVFHKDYPLLPVDELAAQVEKNKHLPGIPSAKEIETGGFEVGEMQGKMMEKIEELTLYVIDANKELKAANENIKTLQEQNETLQQRVKKLEKSSN